MDSSYGKSQRQRRKFHGGAPYSTDTLTISKVKKLPPQPTPVVENESEYYTSNSDGVGFLGALKTIFKKWFTYVPTEEEIAREVVSDDFIEPSDVAPKPLTMQESFIAPHIEEKQSEQIKDIDSLLASADDAQLEKIEEFLKKKRPRDENAKDETKIKEDVSDKDKLVDDKSKLEANPNIVRPSAIHKNLSSVDVINNFLRKNRTKQAENGTPKKTGFPSKPLYHYPTLSPWGPRPYAPVFYNSPPTVTGLETSSPMVKRQKPGSGYAMFPEWYPPYAYPSPYMMPYPLPAEDSQDIAKIQLPSILANNTPAPLFVSEARKTIANGLDRMVGRPSSASSTGSPKEETTSKQPELEIVSLTNKKTKQPTPSTPLTSVVVPLPTKKVEIPKDEPKKNVKPQKQPEKSIAKPKIASFSVLEDEEPVLVDDDEIESEPKPQPASAVEKKPASDSDSDGFTQKKKKPTKKNKKPESSPEPVKKAPEPVKPVEIPKPVEAPKPSLFFGASAAPVTTAPLAAVSAKKSNWIEPDEPQEDFYEPPGGYSDSEDEKEKETKPAAPLFGNASVFSSNFSFQVDNKETKEESKSMSSIFSTPSASSTPLFGGALETKSLFGFGATSSETKSDEPSKPALFGTTEAPKQETKSLFGFSATTSETKSEEPAKSLFTFGASESKPEAPKVEAPKGGLFGASVTETPKETATPSLFTFGAASTETKTEAPKSTLFGASTETKIEAPKLSLFGASTETKTEPAKSIFGAASEPKKETAPVATNLFGFSSQPEPVKDAEKPASIFGSAAPSLTSSFTFGASDKPAEPKKEEAASSMFQFGGSSSTPTASAPAPLPFASPFGSSSTPASTAPSSTFAFGASGNSSSGFGAPSTPASSSFTFGGGNAFGSSTPAAPASSSFAFGGGNTFGNGTPFGGGMDSGMDFNAQQGVGPSKPETPSMFGSTPTGFGGSTGFSGFGAPSQPAPAFGAPSPSPFGAPASSFGGFGASASPAPAPFGGAAPPSGGGAFSIGTGGQNQRKVVRAPRKK